GTPAVAQPVAGGGVAVFRFAEPGRPVIAVDLWGSVRQTGRYLVEPGTGVLDLLTLAGGPALQVESDQAVRTVTVEVSRVEGGERHVVFSEDLDRLTAGGALPPPLLEGDVVTVRTQVSQ